MCIKMCSDNIWIHILEVALSSLYDVQINLYNYILMALLSVNPVPHCISKSTFSCKMDVFTGKWLQEIKLHRAHNKHPSTKLSSEVSFGFEIPWKLQGLIIFLFLGSTSFLECSFICDSKILARLGSHCCLIVFDFIL